MGNNIAGSFGFSTEVAQKSLDAMWLKQKIIASNLANIDTPGYKAQSVEFEDVFQKLLDAVGGKGGDASGLLDRANATVTRDTATEGREDGNNVDVDAENVELARVQMQYEYMVRSVSAEISRMRYVVTEGKG